MRSRALLRGVNRSCRVECGYAAVFDIKSRELYDAVRVAHIRCMDGRAIHATSNINAWPGERGRGDGERTGDGT